MKKFLHEYRHFLSYPRDMRILLLTNLIYAFVLPVIDVFVGAYVMRNSHDVKMVVIYQLAVYTGIPFTFLDQRLPAATRQHQAALFRGHAAERRFDGRDDVAGQAEHDGRRRGRA